VSNTFERSGASMPTARGNSNQTELYLRVVNTEGTFLGHRAGASCRPSKRSAPRSRHHL